MAKNYLFTSESVTEGHPDKVCDKISDAILDEFLRGDADSRVAVETMTTTGFVGIAGEVTSKASFDIESVISDAHSQIPLGRFADPKETAKAICFLASEDAPYINGINLPVDGGRLSTL